jgi:hypothetical protein
VGLHLPVLAAPFAELEFHREAANPGAAIARLKSPARLRERLMKTRLAVVATALALSGHAVLTQAPQEPQHAPDGAPRGMITSIVVPPIPDAPFSATVETEWTRYLDNGRRQVLTNRRLIARDGVGRVFQERRSFVPPGSPIQPQLWRTELAEVSTHTVAYCDTRSHVCELRFYGGPGAAAQTWSSAPPSTKTAGSLVREELGSRSANGLDLVGTRESQPLGLTAAGSDRPLAVVKEFWYSRYLGLNVITKRDDPRSGIEAFTVTDIQLSEPDRGLFTLPANFKVVDLRASSAVSRRLP